jgi:ferric enterobactin receptor
MKLAAIVRLLFTKNRINIIIAFFFLWLATVPVRAQKYQLSFENALLSDALLKASKEFDLKVAFDAYKLSRVLVNKEVAGNTASEFMGNLLLNSGYLYQYRHGRFLIVEQDSAKGFVPAVTCQISGTVYDAESGEQLPFATLVFYNQNYSISATSSGSYLAKNIESNPVHITVGYIGYYTIDTVLTWSSPNVECNFRLSRKVFVIDTLKVLRPKVEMVDFRNQVDFATTINAAKLIDLPTLAETDIFKALQLLPGISYSESSSELSIRGGSSDQNLVLYDGQTLYNISHYYGVFSSVNPNIVRDIQVFKGGYDSRYGERVSGIIDITGKSGNQLKPVVIADMNLLSGNLTVETPLGNKFTFIAAGRRSYSDIYATEFANNLFKATTNLPRNESGQLVTVTTPNFKFYDYNTKLTFRRSDNESMTLNMYGGKDVFKNSYTSNSNNDSLQVSSSDNNTWGNFGVSANWYRQWVNSWNTTLQLGASGYTNRYSNTTNIKKLQNSPPNEPYLPETNNNFVSNNQNKLYDYSLLWKGIAYVNEYNQFDVGVLCRYNKISYHKDAGEIYVYDSTRQSALLNSVYMQDRIFLTGNLSLKPGFRLNYYHGNKNVTLEPRLSANYSFSEKVSTRVAVGMYKQFLSQVTIQQESGYIKNFWVLADDSLHPVVKSTHFVAGTTVELGHFLFDVEAYYKDVSGIQEYIYISQYLKNSDFPNYFKDGMQSGGGANQAGKLSPSYYISGSGKSYGLDFFVRFKANKYTSWVSYSVGKSKQRFAALNNNAEIPAPNDQRHQLSWVNMVSLGKWNLGTTTLFSTGRPYIAKTDYKENMPVIRYYERLPNYFRADLSVNYSLKFKQLYAKTGVTIVNLFNTQNYYDVNTRKFDFENTSFNETSIIRSQKLSLNFFVHLVL